MIYCFDIDDTICASPPSKNYEDGIPFRGAISRINNLYDEKHYIKIFTARGYQSGIDWHETTLSQLKKWGVKYHELIDKGKPNFDILIDDKAVNARDWRKQEGKGVTGFVAGGFDLLHAGHCLFLKEAKRVCDYLYVGLQKDPSCEKGGGRPLGKTKNKPIQTTQERKIQLESVKYIDEIKEYKDEKELAQILKLLKPDIRVLGSDYEGVKATGQEYSEGVVYHIRNHNWSSSELRDRIKKG